MEKKLKQDFGVKVAPCDLAITDCKKEYIENCGKFKDFFEKAFTYIIDIPDPIHPVTAENVPSASKVCFVGSKAFNDFINKLSNNDLRVIIFRSVSYKCYPILEAVMKSPRIQTLEFDANEAETGYMGIEGTLKFATGEGDIRSMTLIMNHAKFKEITQEKSQKILNDCLDIAISKNNEEAVLLLTKAIHVVPVIN